MIFFAELRDEPSSMLIREPNFTVIRFTVIHQFGGCGAAIIITKEKRPRKFSTVPVSQLGLEPKTPSLKGMCSTS